MNKKQVSKLRVIPGDLLLVRGKMPLQEIAQLRAHFSDRVTVAQIPHRNFLQRVPFEILERIYEGARKSFLAKQFEELGPCVRLSLPLDQAHLIASFLDSDANDFGADKPIAEAAAKRLRDALKPAEALMEANNAAPTRS
jgi:hypothetical protein